MATTNGNMLSFKTAKIKESSRNTKSDVTAVPSKPPNTTATSSGAGALTMSNGGGGGGGGGGESNNIAGGKRVWPILPSFAPPRDLTLGGRAPKKVFTPNLNVVRNKNLSVKTSKDTTIKRGGGGRGGRGGRGGAITGGRGGKSSTLVQTKGLFSEGVGEFNVRKSSYSRYSGGGGGGGGNDDSTTSIQKPVLNKDDYKKFDIKADERKLHEITGDSDEDDCFDYFKTETAEDDMPIRLHEAERRAKLLNKNDIKKEEVLLKVEDIKKEFLSDVDDDDDVSTAVATAKKLQKLHVNSKSDVQEEDYPLDGMPDEAPHSALPHYPKTVNGFLNSTSTQLFLLQLPDILPCETDIDAKDFFSKKEPKAPPIDMDASAISAGTTRLNLKSDYDWNKMQEGQIGKIIRYKSGKVCLQLGQTVFDLDIAMEPGFMQDVISVRTNEDYERNIGHMINLGPIHAKITATPYWEECMKRFETVNTEADKL